MKYLAAPDEVAGQDAEFLSERFSEMAEIGKTNFAAGLLNAALSGDQQIFCAL